MNASSETCVANHIFLDCCSYYIIGDIQGKELSILLYVHDLTDSYNWLKSLWLISGRVDAPAIQAVLFNQTSARHSGAQKVLIWFTITLLTVNVYMHVMCVCVFSGAAKKNAKEAQRLLYGRRVTPGDEGSVFEHQRSQETDGEAGSAGGMAVSHWGMGGVSVIYQNLTVCTLFSFLEKTSLKWRERRNMSFWDMLEQSVHFKSNRTSSCRTRSKQQLVILPAGSWKKLVFRGSMVRIYQLYY